MERQPDMKSTDPQAQLLLPWQVNRTLDEAQRAAMKRELASDATLDAEAAWLASLRHILHEEPPRRADDAGLDTLMARIAAEREGRLVNLPTRPERTRPTWLTRGFALAASIILAQAILLGVALEKGGSDLLRPLSGSPQAVQGVHLQVVFREQATESAMRAALISVKGEIVAGPGVLGVYTVRVERQNAEAALLRLRQNSAVVESALREESK